MDNTSSISKTFSQDNLVVEQSSGDGADLVLAQAFKDVEREIRDTISDMFPGASSARFETTEAGTTHRLRFAGLTDSQNQRLILSGYDWDKYDAMSDRVDQICRTLNVSHLGASQDVLVLSLRRSVE